MLAPWRIDLIVLIDRDGNERGRLVLSARISPR